MSSVFTPLYKFSDWPNPAIPAVAAGVYAIWESKTLIYCGMSGREIEKAIASNKKSYGIVNRLHSHASGRLSGDQFCVYVANRIVIPSLSPEQFPKFKSGELNLDKLTKLYIQKNFKYQYALVETSKEAFQLESKARAGGIFGMKPYLNPG